MASEQEREPQLQRGPPHVQSHSASSALRICPRTWPRPTLKSDSLAPIATTVDCPDCKLPEIEYSRLKPLCGTAPATRRLRSAKGLLLLATAAGAHEGVRTYPPGYPEWEKLHAAANPMAAMAGAAAGMASAMTQTAASLVPGKEKGSVTVASFEQVWKQNPGSVMLVDMRDPKEVAAGTIKGAVNIPMNELEKKISSLPTDKPVVFVCGTGARSGEAFDTVKMLGGKVQAWFLDADVKFNADGSYSMVRKK